MNSYICLEDLSVDSACVEKLRKLYSCYMEHKFDLLGSGFVKVTYQIQAKGLHGKRYCNSYIKKYGRKITKTLCGRGKCVGKYEPINWFVDYKSGFFFNPEKYNSLEKCRAVIGTVPWVDIKCPWELGRLYHLLQMAILAVADEMVRESIILEFRNEIIDLIESNPIGKTVQWSAPMDVSIRIVNMLLSYDILMQIDTKGYLSREFQVYFEVHIQQSLKFVMSHLEYIGRTSANHYLSNISGIIFAAAYLPDSSYVNSCLVFGVQELLDQVKKQFYEEGANIEGSTSYHRLSTEFALYSMALIYGILKTEKRNVFLKYDYKAIKRLKKLEFQKFDVLGKEFFPEWFIDRLYNAGIFTKIVLKDNNEVIQIGDNDSGRLVKLTPMIGYNGNTLEENDFDHRTLLSAMKGMFVNKEFTESEKMIPLEASLIRSLSKNKQIEGNLFITYLEEYGDCESVNEEYEYKKENVIFQDNKDNLLDGVRINYFKEFGIVVLKGTRLFLSMVIDTAQNTIYLGHTHNDKLSIELMIDGKYITRDSGGYIYTAFLKGRDKFRSVRAHNTICVDGYEQNDFDGTWGMKKRAKAELLYCARNRLAAKVTYRDVECLRDICILENKIIIRDFANKPFKVAFKNKIYSDGYGKLKRITT